MYGEFSIESVIRPEPVHKSNAISGVGKLKRIYNSELSTEACISNAVADLGMADRQIMFAHSTTEAFLDRFNTVAKIATSINDAKTRGVEGFRHVTTLDPLEYAVEGGMDKIKQFFKNIIHAIVSAFKRIITAIGNLLTWIKNHVASIGVRAQVKDYEFWTKNKAAIMKAADKEVETASFNSLKWKVNPAEFSAFVSKIAGSYIAFTNKNIDKDFVKYFNTELENAKKERKSDDFKKLDENKRNYAITSDGYDARGRFEARGKALRDNINKEYEKIVSDCFGGKLKDGNAEKSARKLLREYLTGGTQDDDTKNTVSMKISEVKKWTDDFKCLSEEWLTKNIKEVIASAVKAQKEMTTFVKDMEKIGKQIDSLFGKELKDGKMVKRETKMATICSQFGSANARLNSFMTSTLLQMESYAFRYRKTAHIALKKYISNYKKKEKKNKKEDKSKESFSFESFMF